MKPEDVQSSYKDFCWTKDHDLKILFKYKKVMPVVGSFWKFLLSMQLKDSSWID